jgi:hypothetical protein
MEYQVLNKTLYLTALVTSESKDGAYYKVLATDDNWECSCPDYTKRGNHCKHIKLVKKGES